MSLEDRLNSYKQNEQRKRDEAVNEARWAVIRQEQERLNQQEERRQNLEDESKQRAALISQLTPLLNAVEVRKQLEIARKHLNAGRIDSYPELVSYIDSNRYYHIQSGYEPGEITPGYGLALRFRYTDAEAIHKTHGGGDGLDYEYHSHTNLFITEARLWAVVRLDEGVPEVSTTFATTIPGDDNKESYVNPPKIITGQDHYGTRYHKSDVIDPGNALGSRKILEDQLFNMLTNNECSFTGLRNNARERIKTDSKVPLYRKILI